MFPGSSVATHCTGFETMFSKKFSRATILELVLLAVLSPLALAQNPLASSGPNSAVSADDLVTPPSLTEEPSLPTKEDTARPAIESAEPRAAAFALNGGLGMGGPNGMSGGLGGPGYGATWYPARPVAGQETDLGLIRQHLSVVAPLYRNGSDALLLNFSLRYSHFFTDAILPDSRRPFPTDLWNVNLGLSYMHKFENGWSGVLMTSFGSPSDKPFHSIDEMNVSLGGFLRIPVCNDRDLWNLGIMYSPAGTLNFPIPMVSYLWNPSEALHLSIGLPLALTWQPTDDWTVNLSYVPLTNVNARVTHQILERAYVYGGYEFLTESYFLADRAIDRDRFIGLEQRLVSGVRWKVWRHANLDFNGGYAFNRQYGEGANQGATLHDRVLVQPAAFLGLNVRMQY
jgi:hypothetical protein